VILRVNPKAGAGDFTTIQAALNTARTALDLVCWRFRSA
jgi:hypothetical protein